MAKNINNLNHVDYFGHVLANNQGTVICLQSKKKKPRYVIPSHLCVYTRTTTLSKCMQKLKKNVRKAPSVKTHLSNFINCTIILLLNKKRLVTLSFFFFLFLRIRSPFLSFFVLNKKINLNVTHTHRINRCNWF